MRPIKFRGRRLDNGAWETGGFVELLGSDMPHNHYVIDKRTGHHTPVIPETVGQFTGLFDKNGKEIYEGDIIGRHTDGGEIVPVSIVVYADNGFSAQSLVSGIDFNFRLESVIERLTVIGNIHDNHELLKTK